MGDVLEDQLKELQLLRRLVVERLEESDDLSAQDISQLGRLLIKVQERIKHIVEEGEEIQMDLENLPGRMGIITTRDEG